MSYFDGVNAYQLPEPHISGRLVMRRALYCLGDTPIESDDTVDLLRCHRSICMIADYLDYKSLLNFYETSKAIQHFINEGGRRPVALLFEPAVGCFIKYSELNALKQAVQNMRIDYIDLCQSQDSLVLFHQLNRYIPGHLKKVRFVDLSRPARIEQPVTPCRLSYEHEFPDTRTEDKILEEHKISNTTAKALLAVFRGMTSLRELSLDNQFQYYMLRDIFRRNLQGANVSL